MYQFRCTDESLPLRIFSRPQTLSLHDGGDTEIFGENQRAVTGQDGLVRGDGNAGFFAVWQRGRVLRTNPQAGGKGGSYTEETLPERVVFL